MIEATTGTSNQGLGLSPISTRATKRSDLRRYFNSAWNLYETLFSCIVSDAHYNIAPDPLRHPIIFYYGHTAAFYINKLKMCGLITEGVNSRFEELFAKGVDPDLPEHLASETIWPSVQEVSAFRKEVYALVLRVIDAIEIPVPSTSIDPVWNLQMAIEHDLIHFETSSVLIRQMHVDHVERPSDWNYAPTFGFSPEFELVKVSAGRVTLGVQEPSELYGWDNEFGRMEVDVKDFAASKNMITNGEFIHFVKMGGYENDAYWSDEALEWKSRTNMSLPRFWIREGAKFRYRAMFDIMDMPLDWPVEVNAHEAKAYCKFKGDEYRLMSEAEFKLLTSRVAPNVEPALSDKYNLKLKFGSPCPVGFLEPENGALFNDLYGNVWDWLSDSFYPFPGFKVHDHYADFSEPYFDEDHHMLLGGSWATNGAGASQFYRLWFRDHFYQHAGFRLAKDVRS